MEHCSMNMERGSRRVKMGRMARKSRRADRRTDALSRDRIVEAAIELLDSEGESGLTFRALATRLATGPGALYWHVPNKDALLAATTDGVVAGVLNALAAPAAPADAIRATALGLFDAIDAHPWVGAQLSRDAGGDTMLGVFERFGAQLQALRVPDQAMFFVASTLVNYVVGAASQNAANARNAHGRDRDAFLATAAARWAEMAPERHAFVKQMAAQLRDHDDRAQFLAGIDLILAGIATVSDRRPRGRRALPGRRRRSERTRS
jgi:AcrR family transcriptional regulator